MILILLYTCGHIFGMENEKVGMNLVSKYTSEYVFVSLTYSGGYLFETLGGNPYIKKWQVTRRILQEYLTIWHKSSITGAFDLAVI